MNETIRWQDRDYQIGAGERVGEIIKFCHMPLMEAKIIGVNWEANYWLAKLVTPNIPIDDGSYIVFTEGFIKHGKPSIRHEGTP